MLLKQPVPRHTIIKMKKLKDKVRILKEARYLVNYKETPIRLSAEFSTQTFQARKNGMKYSK